MSLALFITHAVPTTVVDQVLISTERVGSCASSFFVAEPEDVSPLERKNEEGTKTPIPDTWQSRYLDFTPQQCSDSLKAMVPEPVDEEDDEGRSSRRFAILDEEFMRSGKLLACNREQDDSVTSFRWEPNLAALNLEAWYPDQWEYHVKNPRDQLVANNRAAFARSLAESERSIREMRGRSSSHVKDTT